MKCFPIHFIRWAKIREIPRTEIGDRIPNGLALFLSKIIPTGLLLSIEHT